jgi:hypothetical protein
LPPIRAHDLDQLVQALNMVSKAIPLLFLTAEAIPVAEQHTSGLTFRRALAAERSLTLEVEAAVPSAGLPHSLREIWWLTFQGVAAYLSRPVGFAGNAPLTRLHHDWMPATRPHPLAPCTWEIIGSALVAMCGAPGLPPAHLHHYVIETPGRVYEVIARDWNVSTRPAEQREQSVVPPFRADPMSLPETRLEVLAEA